MKIRIINLFIGIFLGMFVGIGIIDIIEGNSCVSKNTILYNDTIIKRATIKVTGTVYNPRKNQCDSTPCITSDGTIIDTINHFNTRILAISRDLFEVNGGFFNYGDTIVISNSEVPLLSGKWIVHDTMNKRKKRSIDFLVEKINYGKWDIIIAKWKKRK